MDRRTIPGRLLAAHATTLLGHPLAPRTHDTTRIVSTPLHATAHLVATEPRVALVATTTGRVANRRHAPDLSIPMMSGMIPSGRLSHGALAPHEMAGTTRPQAVIAATAHLAASRGVMTAMVATTAEAAGTRAMARVAGTTTNGKKMVPWARRIAVRAMAVAHAMASGRRMMMRGTLD